MIPRKSSLHLAPQKDITILLTICPVLYFMSSRLYYFLTRSLYILIPFFFTQPSNPTSGFIIIPWRFPLSFILRDKGICKLTQVREATPVSGVKLKYNWKCHSEYLRNWNSSKGSCIYWTNTVLKLQMTGPGGGELHFQVRVTQSHQGGISVSGIWFCVSAPV